jgi:predicted lipoprotein with Yx(FWY)xxD motif
MTRTRSITFLASGAALLLVALAVAGCGSSGSSSSSAPPTTPSGRQATVGISNSGLGKILVNSQGHTLYVFQKDTGTTSTCTGACASNWPPLRANGKPKLGSGANASLVGTTMRSDGTSQVTYNGHPLYTFADDTKPGDTNGQGINAFGGLWYAVSPTGSQVTGSSGNSGGGGTGY